MHSQERALRPDEVAGLLGALGTAIRAEVGALPDDVLSWHPAPGEWCAKECLGHMLEADRRGFNGRIRSMLASESAKLVAWDQQAVARARNDCQRPAADLLAEFEALRSDSVGLVG